MSSPPGYPTDLNEEEWAVVDKILGGPPKLGRPPRFKRRAVLGAIFHKVRTGRFLAVAPARSAAMEHRSITTSRGGVPKGSLKSSMTRCAMRHGSRAEKMSPDGRDPG